MQETLSRETPSRGALNHEALNHAALNHEALNHEALNHAAPSRETLSRQAPSRETLSREALSRGREPAGTLASVAVLLGAVGLFVFNLIFGPLAIGLAVTALRRSGPPSTANRVVAWAGFVLGAADLVILAVLLAISLAHGSVTWHFGA